MEYFRQNVELWAFLIVAIPLVVRWLYIFAFNYLNIYKFTLVSAMKRANKRKFQSGVDLIENIKKFPSLKEEKISEFIRTSLIHKVYYRPFHLEDVIDKLECLKKLGLISKQIHTIMLNQMIEFNNQLLNQEKQNTSIKYRIDLEKQLDVDSILMPPLVSPNNCENEEINELRNYLELKNRFKQISELDFTFAQLFMYVFRRIVAKYIFSR